MYYLEVAPHTATAWTSGTEATNRARGKAQSDLPAMENHAAARFPAPGWMPLGRPAALVGASLSQQDLDYGVEFLLDISPCRSSC